MNKMADVPPSEKKEESCSIEEMQHLFSTYVKKETSFVCLTCIVALCITLCFGEYNMKKNV
jgi:hypothetical protein